ncbi:FG-GAP and VCBS repeat-containing protein [Streptomyces sp. NPDC006332]|uniref:FG-GAP and VCBS repeat-containing protein n=1 Tax=Streptomyces sp. NPDC006332 TaxID=3155456 RepID=UPI0033AA56BD
MRKRVCLVAVAALLASGPTSLALSAPASAAAAKYADDFNGDGYRDLALGDRTATAGGKKEAGAVVVIWGTAQGLNRAKHTVVSQNSAGVEGAAEAGDFFGAKITTADMNKDGYADIVATSPGEETGSGNQGTFTILWGSKTGISGGSSYATPSGREVGFAKDVAVGDFDADGRLDVAAVDDEYVWFVRGAFTKSGARGKATNLDPIDGEDINPELVVAGKVTKDGTADFAVIGWDADTNSNRVWFYRGSSTGPVKPPKKTGLPASSELVGSAAVIADFDKNGYGDLAVGVSRSGKGGAVHVLKGTSTGFGTAKTLSQDSPGVPGGRESVDYFGYDVSAADTNGDGYPDLAVGVPGEVIGSNLFRTGAVTVLRGSATGLTGTGARQYDYASAGVEGDPAEENDTWFGASVLLRDFNRDGRAELNAAAWDAGRLHFLPGTTSGPTGTGSALLTAAELGLGTTRTSFGAALAD